MLILQYLEKVQSEVLLQTSVAKSTTRSLFYKEVYSLIEITKGYFIHFTECHRILFCECLKGSNKTWLLFEQLEASISF